VATFDNLATSPYASNGALSAARAASALVILGSQLYLVVGPGFIEHITYLPGSKLRDCDIPITGSHMLLFFTAWSWVILGLSFAGMAYIGAANARPCQYLLRVVLTGWEIAAPCALLVSVIITYVIWPEFVKKGPVGWVLKTGGFHEHKSPHFLFFSCFFTGRVRWP